MLSTWLDRRIAAPGPHLALALDEVDFKALCKHIDVEPPQHFTNEHSHATTWFFENKKDGALIAIVAIGGWQGRDPIEVAGLLVHESVHVWQRHAERIGESAPGLEQEAYAVQSIAQELMAEFARRVAKC